MHGWLPDAHTEAPSPISALLSAVLLNCAIYAVLRFDAITSRAIGSGFSHTLLLIFGGVSLAVASLLMIVQRDLKTFSFEELQRFSHQLGRNSRPSAVPKKHATLVLRSRIA